MSGQQHGDHLIAQFLIAHGPTIFVSGFDKHGHNVGASVLGCGFALGNLLVQHCIDFVAELTDALPRGERSQVDLQPTD